jgi:AraC-like DNA-binding protein
VWEANRVVVGDVGIIASHYTAGLRASTLGPSANFQLVVATHGGGSTRQGGAPAPLAPGRSAVMSSPALPTEFRIESGFQSQTVTIPGRVVETTLAALTGVSRARALQFELSVDTTIGGGTRVLRLLEFIVGEANRAPRSPIVEGRLAEAFVCALLTELPHNQSNLFSTTPNVAEPRCVRRAEEYMEAHALRHIGLADLASASGVSLRTLTASFRAHRGCSPMAFLRTRRFERARKLLAASPSATISEVALCCGFAHLGRFSVEYQKRFGERPSETQRRRGHGTKHKRVE